MNLTPGLPNSFEFIPKHFMMQVEKFYFRK